MRLGKLYRFSYDNSVRVPLPSVSDDVQVVEVNDSPMRASRWRSSHKGVMGKLIHLKCYVGHIKGLLC